MTLRRMRDSQGDVSRDTTVSDVDEHELDAEELRLQANASP